ncbi:MAG: type VI secretion system tip protein VgrG [Polyangiaceae bacterium]|nr:type VI secretion system tip protein VgrG [Polyangiaceae bacterium]
MPLLQLSFASGEDSLAVSRFSVTEAMSSLFDVSVWARSPSEDIDLDSIVGKPAVFKCSRGLSGGARDRATRRFAGIVSFMEQIDAEPTGASTYFLRIVPAMWLLTQRRNHRVFQHLSVPAIVKRLLKEWSLEARWKIDEDRYPKLEYRVQYGESDFNFIRRLLEEAGISFSFTDDNDRASDPIFWDRPSSNDVRSGGPIHFVDSPSESSEEEFVTDVRIAHEVRPGKVAIRDFDFRRSPEFKLLAEATGRSRRDDKLEQHFYEPGAFLVDVEKGEGKTPVADDRGAARHDEKAAKELAVMRWQSERVTRRAVSFETNALDLSPGTVFSMRRHPRPDLGSKEKLLVIESSIEGGSDEEWQVTGRAVFASKPYRPPIVTPKPQIHSVQSAIVVGPKGQEIHTDEFGRVRVQFHWDREGNFDETSSCWMRVSQGSTGGGFGMFMLPRVGTEVLVGFFEGDPDQPVVVGRVFNNTARVPYKLPEHRTVSTWKSDSTPRSDGFNEIKFDDERGNELVSIQAERDLKKLVKADETETTGANRTISVGANRTSTVAAADNTTVGSMFSARMAGAPTGIEMVNGRIAMSTGEATITIEGPNITMEAAARILLQAASAIEVNAAATIKVGAGATVVVQSEGGDVVIQGGPMVRINPRDRRSEMADFSGGPDGTAPEDDDIPEGPPGADIDGDAVKAKERQGYSPENVAFFKNELAGAAEGDPKEEAYRNFRLGVMGKALGLPEGAILRMAGKRYQAKHGASPDRGDPGNGIFGGTAPYGNSPSNLEMLEKGFAYFYENHAG